MQRLPPWPRTAAMRPLSTAHIPRSSPLCRSAVIPLLTVLYLTPPHRSCCAGPPQVQERDTREDVLRGLRVVHLERGGQNHGHGPGLLVQVRPVLGLRHLARWVQGRGGGLPWLGPASQSQRPDGATPTLTQPGVRMPCQAGPALVGVPAPACQRRQCACDTSA